MTHVPTPPSHSPTRLPKSLEVDDWVHAQLARTSMGLSPISLALAAADWGLHLGVSPGRQWALVREAFELAQQAWLEAARAAVLGAAPAAPDHRFAEPGWSDWPYSAWRNVFKASEQWWDDALQVKGLTPHHRQMVEFFAHQWLDAMSPSNWPATNPEVLNAGLASAGQSWVAGLQQWAADTAAVREESAAALRGPAAPLALPPLAYRVGVDVAVTPGKVVYRNRLIELIQYLPSTPKVAAEPLLIVPSCIMKYYILDLSPGNSMVRYLVGQGYTVFMVSWRNPDAADRDLGMDDYVLHGVIDAMAAVKTCTSAARIHTLGYCLGGTFLAIAAALHGKSRRKRRGGRGGEEAPDALRAADMPELASVVLLAAETDFSEPGDLGVFIDEDQVKTLREAMARTGYLSGRQMAASFQFLNARDLIWSRNTRRYLMGTPEVQNDLMSWNSDVTRLPQRMHSEYLGALFLRNALTEGHYQVDGTAVALIDITVPMLVVGTTRDHVCPWRSVYKIHLSTDVETTFVLAAGGHNAGIVSEPGHPGRSYQMAATPKGHGWVDPDDWLKSASLHGGSWWEAMAAWLAARSGAPVPARSIPVNRALGDAPGEYVLVRYAD